MSKEYLRNIYGDGVIWSEEQKQIINIVDKITQKKPKNKLSMCHAHVYTCASFPEEYARTDILSQVYKRSFPEEDAIAWC